MINEDEERLKKQIIELGGSPHVESSAQGMVDSLCRIIRDMHEEQAAICMHGRSLASELNYVITGER